MTSTTTNTMTTVPEEEESEESILRKTLKVLSTQRFSMEQEADVILAELTTPPAEGITPMGLDTPLVDSEGYPRGDVDLVRARTLRGRFQVLKNDHKDITKRIERLLIQLTAIKSPARKEQDDDERKKREAAKPKPKFDPVTGKWVVMNWDGSVAGVPGGDKRDFGNLTSQLSGLTEESGYSPPNSSRAGSSANPSNSTATTNTPFCRVNAVAAESPAEEAGLLEDDLIVRFGPLHIGNHNHLKAISILVPEAASNQDSIALQILRRPSHTGADLPLTDWDRQELVLSPKPWAGRGMLGCHIVPYVSSS